jgi:hypothetical protein
MTWRHLTRSANLTKHSRYGGVSVFNVSQVEKRWLTNDKLIRLSVSTYCSPYSRAKDDLQPNIRLRPTWVALIVWTHVDIQRVFQLATCPVVAGETVELTPVRVITIFKVRNIRNALRPDIVPHESVFDWSRDSKSAQDWNNV